MSILAAFLLHFSGNTEAAELQFSFSILTWPSIITVDLSLIKSTEAYTASQKVKMLWGILF